MFYFIQVDVKDPASGATYYYNQQTGTCQWERPVKLSAPPVPPREEWIETLDEASGRIFTHFVIMHIGDYKSIICFSFSYCGMMLFKFHSL